MEAKSLEWASLGADQTPSGPSAGLFHSDSRSGWEARSFERPSPGRGPGGRLALVPPPQGCTRFPAGQLRVAKVFPKTESPWCFEHSPHRDPAPEIGRASCRERAKSREI